MKLEYVLTGDEYRAARRSKSLRRPHAYASLIRLLVVGFQLGPLVGILSTAWLAAVDGWGWLFGVIFFGVIEWGTISAFRASDKFEEARVNFEATETGVYWESVHGWLEAEWSALSLLENSEMVVITLPKDAMYIPTRVLVAQQIEQLRAWNTGKSEEGVDSTRDENH